MANIAHSVLAGTEIHEPKGVAAASLGEVYVADGSGSGNWANVGTSSFTGMISDFCWAEVQDGWLECDGSDINITTYGTLFAVMTIQQDGTRTSASNVVTSIPSTAKLKVGYYVYGTGIPEDTTITVINSATQITMSANASSTGTATIIASPWRMGSGTIRLPDLTTAGRYRRSRTSSTRVGETQADAFGTHTHGVVGTTGQNSVSHTHGVAGYTGYETVDHTHSELYPTGAASATFGTGGIVGNIKDGIAGTQTGGANANHQHYFSVTSGGASVNHTHDLNIMSAASGAFETRPLTIVVMTCVKT